MSKKKNKVKFLPFKELREECLDLMRSILIEELGGEAYLQDKPKFIGNLQGERLPIGVDPEDHVDGDPSKIFNLSVVYTPKESTQESLDKLTSKVHSEMDGVVRFYETKDSIRDGFRSVFVGGGGSEGIYLGSLYADRITFIYHYGNKYILRSYPKDLFLASTLTEEVRREKLGDIQLLP